MASMSEPITTVQELAERIEIDIRARGLRSGERYMTADELGGTLGISVGMAHRAMRLLAENGKLVRRRNVGTFVGPELGSATRAGAAICVIIPARTQYRSGLPVDDLIRGLVCGHKGVHVHVISLPEERPGEYLEQMLAGVMEAGPVAGVVPVSCPISVTERLSRLHVPMVVLGSLYATQQSFSSIDVDNREAGRLAIRCLAERGHRRIAVMMTGSGRPGDNAFLDGLMSAMGELQLPMDGLIVRISPPDRDGFVQQVNALLNDAAPPDGLVVRSTSLAETAMQVINAHDGPRPEVVAQTLSPLRLAPPLIAAVGAALGMDEIGGRIAAMLSRLADEHVAEPEHVRVSVALTHASTG
jgi:DNA-binding LacI/PurR family transcriptional regulator